MRAILLAAGFGTRLRPLTNSIPKCLVPINGQPLLDIWLENLTRAKVGPFLINTHYLSEKVNEYVETSKYRDQITLIYEEELLGTAGTLRSNYDFFNKEDGMLVHADNYTICDFKEFVRVHNERPRISLMTMMSFRTDTPESCGIIQVNEEGTVINFQEKIFNPDGNLANGAVYIVTQDLIKWIVAEELVDFSTQVIPPLLGKITSYENTHIHIDIGTIKSYELAQTINEIPGKNS